MCRHVLWIIEYVLLKMCSNLIAITLRAPCISESCIEIKINYNFYFHTSLWCLKRFYEDLEGLHKTFGDTTKIVKIKI